MIDTLKLFIPLQHSDVELIKQKCTKTKREHLISKRVEYEYYYDMAKLGSHNHTIAIRAIDSLSIGIFVEFSVPKYYFGNNIEMISPEYVSDILESFRDNITKHFGISFPTIDIWEIWRLDLCYNWTFETKEKARSFMDFIQRIDYPRKKKYQYDTSVMYKGSAFTVKFYLKGPEFLKHDYKRLLEQDPDKTIELMAWAHKVLRFEVEFRKSYLTCLLGVEKAKIENIIDNSEIIEILKHYLAGVFKYINRENMKYEDIRQHIANNFSATKTLRLYQFYKGYYYDTEGTKNLYRQGGLNRSTIYRYKKDLQEIGVGFSTKIDNKDYLALSEIVIPSEKGLFRLLDYKSSIDYS